MDLPRASLEAIERLYIALHSGRSTTKTCQVEKSDLAAVLADNATMAAELKTGPVYDRFKKD